MLPNDISRCVGRTALGPDDPVCPVRAGCGRYQALLEHGRRDEPCVAPCAMHLCQTADFERRIPVEA